MGTDIRIASADLTAGLQSYVERPPHFSLGTFRRSPLSARCAPDEKREAGTVVRDFGHYRTLNAAGRRPEDRVILRDDLSRVREKDGRQNVSGRRFIFSRITMKEEQTHDQH